MQLLRVPMFNHLSNHSERSLSFPANYLAPLLTMLSPFFMPDQVEEQDVGLRRLVGLLLLPRYLWDRTRTHNDDFSVLNLQFSLANNAAFFGLAAWIPRPLASLSLVIFFHPIRWSFFFLPDEPHIKFLFNLSTPSRILGERTTHCIV